MCTCALCLLAPCCSKSELLVVLKQPEGFDGPTHVSFITDNANHLVLHWGTCKPGEGARGLGGGQGRGGPRGLMVGSSVIPGTQTTALSSLNALEKNPEHSARRVAAVVTVPWWIVL